MDARPHKFQSIVLGRNRDISFSISVQENLIVPTDNIKVLGVTLDDHLKFDAHITNICITAFRQINALKRLAKFLNERSRILIYKSFISSNFSYCPVTWMFCGRKNVMKLEKLQERALRFVFNDNNFSNVVTAWILCIWMIYSVNKKWSTTLLEQPKFSTKTYGYRSFRYYGAKLWNALPFEIKNTDDHDDFKSKLTAWCHSSNLDKLAMYLSRFRETALSKIVPTNDANDGYITAVFLAFFWVFT